MNRVLTARIPEVGDVILRVDPANQSCGWCKMKHYRSEPVLSYSMEAFPNPTDADLAEGFWVDFSWDDPERGPRGNLWWLAKDAPDGNNPGGDA